MVQNRALKGNFIPVLTVVWINDLLNIIQGRELHRAEENHGILSQDPKANLTISLKENESTDETQICNRDLVLIYQTAPLFQAMG